MNIAYLDCFSGISGDMALAALIDAGASVDDLRAGLAALDLSGYQLAADRVARAGIAATDVRVEVEPAAVGHAHGRRFSDIRKMIEQSGLPEDVKLRSVSIFRRLGEAEARVHGTDIAQVHFHEVGAVDAIVDIVGVCVCLSLLQVETVHCSPMPTFHGTVTMSHGTFPLPAPATAEILKGVPWRHCGIEGELVTPTGAAIARELAEGFGEMPPMVVRSIGYGAGKNDFGIPNVLRVMIGHRDTAGAGAEVSECEEVALLEANIDDLNPQVYEIVMERLFAAGALDVYLTPIQMKKTRPAVLLSVLCAPADTSVLTSILFDETSTLGVRVDHRRRICLPRESDEVTTPYGRIRIKIGSRSGRITNVQPEYEDCKAAAREHRVPVKMVHDAAIAAFYSSL